MDFCRTYFEQVAEIARKINPAAIAELVDRLATLRDHGGRLFVLGVGGSAANASHAINDFRTSARSRTYEPTAMSSAISAPIWWRPATSQGGRHDRTRHRGPRRGRRLCCSITLA